MCEARGIVFGKPEGKRLLGRPRHRWENNFVMDFWKKWRALVNKIMKLGVQ